MSIAAYPTTVKVPGTSTAFADLPATLIVSGFQYQITDTTKRRLDPTVAIVVQVSPNGSTWNAPSGAYTIDYLFGQVTFATDQTPNTQVRFHSGNYLPMQAIGQAKDFELSVSVDMPDTTPFNAAGVHSRTPTLRDASFSCSSFQLLNLNPITGAQSLSSLRDSRAVVLVELNPGGAGTYWCGWMYVAETSEKGQPAGVYEAEVKFESAPVTPNGATGSTTLFGWGS